MKIFLIDFENVHSEGIAGVDNLSENDEVVIFYSNNADSISFEMMHKLMFSKAKLSYYKVRRGGRNALDFQMASYLGYLVNNCVSFSDIEFFLISKDNGFDFVIDFWESGNINIKPSVKRFFTIKAAFGQKKTAEPIKAEAKPEVVAPPAAVVAEAATAAAPEIIEAPAPIAEAVEAVEAVKIVEKPKVVPKVIKKNPTAKKKPVIIKEAPAVAEEETPIVEIDLETTAAIEELLESAKSPHDLYISTVKRFGQKKGVEVYRNIKSRFFVKKTV
jgi:hypothetical protein